MPQTPPLTVLTLFGTRLGKHVLVLRDVTERPEAVEAGVATLVSDPESLAAALKAEYWRSDGGTAPVPNPFGHGDSGDRIARAVWRAFHPRTAVRKPKSEVNSVSNPARSASKGP